METIRETLNFGDTKIIKIISGGQTGADFGGLLAGFNCDVETGGIAPKGFRTEKGSNQIDLEILGLIESDSSDYSKRTEQNVINSDITIILGDIESAGSKQTAAFCRKHNKIYFTSQYTSDLSIIQITKGLNNISGNLTVNVAGNRESKNPGIEQRTLEFITKIINLINGEQK